MTKNWHTVADLISSANWVAFDLTACRLICLKDKYCLTGSTPAGLAGGAGEPEYAAPPTHLVLALGLDSYGAD